MMKNKALTAVRFAVVTKNNQIVTFHPSLESAKAKIACIECEEKARSWRIVEYSLTGREWRPAIMPVQVQVNWSEEKYR